MAANQQSGTKTNPATAFAILVALCTLSSGCPVSMEGAGSGQKEDHPPRESKVLAKIGEEPIYADEFQVHSQINGNNAKLASVEERRVLLDRYITARVVANEARRRGFEKRPRVQSLMKSTNRQNPSAKEKIHYRSRVDNALVQELTVEEMQNRVKLEDVSFQEVRAYYDSHVNEFKKGFRLRLASSRVQADSGDSEKRALLENLRKTIEGLPVGTRGEKIEQMAGLLFSKGVRYVENLSSQAQLQRWAGVVNEQAKKLDKDGALSPVFHDGRHWVLLLRTGSEKAESIPYEKVEIRLREQLLQDKRQKAFEAFVSELKTNAKITINEQVLANL